MWKLLILFTVVVKSADCVDSNSTNATTSPYILTACSGALERWRRALISYTGKSIQELITLNTNETVIEAPMKIIYALTHIALYSEGQTLSQLLKLLDVNDKEEIKCILEEIYEYTKELPVEIRYNSSVIFVADNKLKFTDDFKQDLTNTTFTVKAFNMDLGKPVQASRMINNIIANNTHGEVLNTVESSKLINKQHGLNIISGVYYRMNTDMFWYNNLSISNYFPYSNQSHKSIFGYNTGICNYTESSELDAKVIRLPLKDKLHHAVVFLPNSDDGFNKMVQMLRDEDLVAKIWDSFKLVRLNMYMPVYTNMENVIDSGAILKKVANISSIFRLKPRSFIVNKKLTALTLAYQKVVLKYNMDSDSKETTDDEDCPEDSNEYEFIADRPVVIYIVRNCLRIPTLCFIGKPITWS